MGILQQEYYRGLSCPPPGDLSNPGMEPRSPTLQVDSLPSEPPRKPISCSKYCISNYVLWKIKTCILRQVFQTEIHIWSFSGFFFFFSFFKIFFFLAVLDWQNLRGIYRDFPCTSCSHVCSLPCYQHPPPPPDWYSGYNWWSYIDVLSCKVP